MSHKKIDAIHGFQLAPTRGPNDFAALEKLNTERSEPAGRVMTPREANPLPPAMTNNGTTPAQHFLAFLLQTDPAFHAIARERSRLKDIARRAWERFMNSREAAKQAFEKATTTHIDLATIRYKLFITHFLAVREHWLHHIANDIAQSSYHLAWQRYHSQSQEHHINQHSNLAKSQTAMHHVHTAHAEAQRAILETRRFHDQAQRNITEGHMSIAVAMSLYQSQWQAWQNLANQASPAAAEPAAPRRPVKVIS